MKLLIVDDEYYFRKALIQTIPMEAFGISKCLEAEDGEAAIREIEEQKPDIIFADINMPKMNGLTLIERIKKADPSLRVVIISGYDEFEYARKGLQFGVDRYLLKPVEKEELFDALSCLIQDIQQERLDRLRRNQLEVRAVKNEFIERQLFLHKLLSIRCASGTEQVLSDLGTAGTAIGERRSFLAAAVRTKAERNRELNNMIVMNMLAGSIERIFDSLVCIDSNGMVILLVLDITVGQISLLQQEIKNCQERIWEKHQFTTCAGIGNIKGFVWEICDSYGEAVKAVELRTQSRQSELIMYGYYEEGEYHVSEADKKCLETAVLEQNTGAAEELMDLIFTKAENSTFSVNSAKTAVWDIFSFLGKLQERICDRFEADTKKDLVFLQNQIHNSSSYPEMKKYVYGIAEVLCESSVLRKKTCPDVVKKMTSLIHERFGDSELSVEMLSNELFMNYNYLCVLFKKYMGQTINDYITKIRMQKALEYIGQGTKRVTELAEKTGFANEGYFAKCFKKEYGLPPSRYISMYVSGECGNK